MFGGENYTAKNSRHCVNSLAIDFVHDTEVLDSEEAMVAGGCFWGVEYYLQQINGVLLTQVGYTGGTTINPSYHDVCQGNTGHFEAIRVLFDPKKTNYETIIKTFLKYMIPASKMGKE